MVLRVVETSSNETREADCEAMVATKVCVSDASERKLFPMDTFLKSTIQKMFIHLNRLG
jgi:hypothetical protein